MGILWIIIFVFGGVICSRSNLDLSSESSELVAAAVLFRHGDRSPLNSFPDDPYYNEKYWPMGFGQLTPNGIKRAHSLGEWFRQRYNNFLSEIYSPKEIYTWSTDTDRTIMTAQSVLSGLYPPKGFQLWNANVPWQPIPVHTVARPKDDIIMEKRYCPKYNRLLKKAMRKATAKIEQEYNNIFQLIKENSGWTTVTLEEVQRFRNQLYVFQNYNKTFIPEWSKLLSSRDLNYVADVPYQVPTSTKTLARLRIGPFFNRLFHHFENFTAECPLKLGYKFLILSCHDTCIASALDAMGAYDFRPIGFSDTVIWELRKWKNGKYFINLLYKSPDRKDQAVERFKIFDCDFDCSYSKFKDYMNDINIHIDDWEKECHEDLSSSSITYLNY